jgi:hypothetical protein
MSSTHTLAEFFNRPAFTAAYSQSRGERSFADYYHELLESFYDALNSDWSGISCGNNSNSNIFNNAVRGARDSSHELGEAICQTLQQYHDGVPYEAMMTLFRALDNATDLDKLIFDIDKDLRLPKRLFKVRVSDNPATDIRERKEIFHIPFCKRHLVQSHRFSIPGIPCLYLGSSLYVCWEEMERPAFHKLSFSRFEQTEQYRSQKVLHIGVDPQFIRNAYANTNHVITDENLENFSNYFSNYLKIYPLQLACSIPCQYRTAPYREEYIIAQLLMQWVRSSEKFQGVAYRTTRVPQNRTDYRLLVNYAFPVQSIEQQGYCSVLSGIFNFTDPVPFELSIASPVRNTRPLERGHTEPTVCDAKLPFGIPVYYGPNTLINYTETNFGCSRDCRYFFWQIS